MKVTLIISHFNPEIDTKQHFKEYKVEVRKNSKVLDAIIKAWDKDQGFSFRRSCRSGICGSCAMTINGKTMLACHTLIREVAGDDQRIVVGPLRRFRQVKDLVVDLEPFFESLKSVIPWVLPKAGYDGRMSAESAAIIENPATCILCGACNADLSVPGEVKPVALVKAARLALDVRDRLGASRLGMISVERRVLSKFLEELPEVCPKKIRISGKFMEGAL